tara:strand:+ start:9812 stop:10105 length:294 start_codon:yes stop_codon:yes gene_type:complete
VSFRQAPHSQLCATFAGNLCFAHCLEVSVDDVDTHLATIGESRDQRAQSFRGATRATDNTAEILWVHANLEKVTALRVLCNDLNLLGVVNDSLDEMF